MPRHPYTPTRATRTRRPAPVALPLRLATRAAGVALPLAIVGVAGLMAWPMVARIVAQLGAGVALP